MKIQINDNKNTTNITHLADSTEWIIYDTCASNFTVTTSADLHWWVNKYVIKIKRRSNYYIYSLVLPCMILSLLSILIFLLPTDSTDQITLGVTILLAFYINGLVVADYTPEASSEISIIGVYYTFNIIFVALLIAGSILIININSASQKRKQVPNWLKSVLFISKPKKFEIKTNTLSRKDMYATTTLKRSMSINHNNTEPTVGESTMIKKLNCSCLFKLERHLIAIYRLLNTNLKKAEIIKNQTEYEKEIWNDWLLVAKRIEFLFFLISFIIVLITPLYLFGHYYFRDLTKNTLNSICGC
jgi:hypothetical protein